MTVESTVHLRQIVERRAAIVGLKKKKLDRARALFVNSADAPQDVEDMEVEVLQAEIDLAMAQVNLLVENELARASVSEADCCSGGRQRFGTS